MSIDRMSRRRLPSPRTRGEGLFALLLLTPAALVVFGVVVYPAARALVISLYDVNTPFNDTFPFVGLRNYGTAFSDPTFGGAIARTLYFTVVSTVAELVLGIAVALLLNGPLRMRWFWRGIVVLPWALPTIVNGAMWKWIYNGDYGPLNSALVQLHLLGDYKSWLGEPFLAMNMVVIADVWKNTSIVAFFILAGLQLVPKDVQESARVDGAGVWRTFVSITLPLLRPAIAVVLILRTIEAFKVFDIIYVMTGGGPANGTQTIAYFTYVQAFSNQEFGYGSALAYLIVLAVFVIAVGYLRVLRQQQLEGSG